MGSSSELRDHVRRYRRAAVACPVDRRAEAACIARNPDRLPILVLGPAGEPLPVGRVGRVVIPLYWYARPPWVDDMWERRLRQFSEQVLRGYLSGTLFDDTVTVLDFPEPGGDTGFFGAVSLDVSGGEPEMCFAGRGIRPTP